MTIKLQGRIDSNNAAEREREIQERLEGSGAASVELDAADLEYISSAGLRIILHLKKAYPDVYEKLQMVMKKDK